MSHPTICGECGAPMRHEFDGPVDTGWHCSMRWVHGMQAEVDALKGKLSGAYVELLAIESERDDAIAERDAALAELVEYTGTMCHALEINAPGEDAVKNREQVADAIRTIRSDLAAAQATVAELRDSLQQRERELEEAKKVHSPSLASAARTLRKLRLTEVGGRKENPAITVSSALKSALGCLYDDTAVEYLLNAGIRYYLAARAQQESDAAKEE